ncbi:MULTISPECIES: hypothetical protein [unclassified Methanoculleus]|jgi:uncharacterized short protein YbdD (DUF466 family)|uniref:Uncharacterized protein n=1 Tax=Methanoculleus palmolei TaxID=72612 RepID=A0ABD8A9Q4_9EURY|nr:hypothetical protein [Methanoculleus sp. UBA377]MDD2473457.1 hypothetical protein [Methanoculleus sp.]WOX56253.1 hypothetical protein R6Y95_02690 [Methanoculleus palmolei]
MKTKDLSGISALFAALLVVGAIFVPAVSATQENDSLVGEGDTNYDQIASAQKTLRITPETPGMSKEEFVAYSKKMEQKYGSENVTALKSHIDRFVQSSSGLPDITRNLQYVTAWNEHLEAKNDDGVVMASSDNVLSLYKLDVTDEQGRDHYYWWQWSAAQNREDVWMGDDSNLKNFWNRIKFEDSTSNLLIYSPDSDLIGNEDTVTVGLGAEYKGVGCSISKDFVLHQDKIRPKPGECQVGSAGKYAVDWVGDYEGTQSIYGACEERRPPGASATVQWTYNLTANLV